MNAYYIYVHISLCNTWSIFEVSPLSFPSSQAFLAQTPFPPQIFRENPAVSFIFVSPSKAKGMGYERGNKNPLTCLVFIFPRLFLRFRWKEKFSSHLTSEWRQSVPRKPFNLEHFPRQLLSQSLRSCLKNPHRLHFLSTACQSTSGKFPTYIIQGGAEAISRLVSRKWTL